MRKTIVHYPLRYHDHLRYHWSPRNVLYVWECWYSLHLVLVADALAGRSKQKMA